MKFHLPFRFFKALMAVVCVPGTTIAADAVGNVYPQPVLYVGSAATLSGNTALPAAETSATLRWDSVDGESAVWDTENTAVWTDVGSGTSDVTFKTGSQVQFGEAADLNKAVQIAPEGVTASTVEITGSGYQFSGGELIVEDRLIARESATIDSALVMGSSTSPLTIEVADGKVLTTNIST